MESPYTSPSTKPLYRGTQLVWYVLGILETLLSLRFFLRLFGANSEAGFTSFIYTISDIFVSPFMSVFRNTNINGGVLEWGTLLAMVVYWILAALLIRLLTDSRAVSTREAANNLENQSE